MAGGHCGCSEHELGQTPENGKGQGSLVCCSPWDCKESAMTGQPNNSSNMKTSVEMPPKIKTRTTV